MRGAQVWAMGRKVVVYSLKSNGMAGKEGETKHGWLKLLKNE